MKQREEMERAKEAENKATQLKQFNKQFKKDEDEEESLKKQEVPDDHL